MYYHIWIVKCICKGGGVGGGGWEPVGYEVNVSLSDDVCAYIGHPIISTNISIRYVAPSLSASSDIYISWMSAEHTTP